jgi:hypothetical protein
MTLHVHSDACGSRRGIGQLQGCRWVPLCANAWRQDRTISVRARRCGIASGTLQSPMAFAVPPGFGLVLFPLQ